MIVVSNTSPLTNLASIDQFDILLPLYSEIHTHLDALRQNAGFYLTDQVYQLALELAAESSQI